MLFPGLLALIAFIVADLVRAPLRLIWLAEAAWTLLAARDFTTNDDRLVSSGRVIMVGPHFEAV
jgi:hypothetical protein